MASSAPQVRMDKSRDYATVHGERPPGDRHANVHFFQGGLPFDSRGVLIPDHPDIIEDEKLKAKADKLLKNAAKTKSKAPGDDAVAGDNDDGDGSEPTPVNLAAWASGEGDWPWQEVTNAIGRRYSKRVNSRRDALEFLVAEKVVAYDDLSVSNQKLLDAD